MDSFSLLLFGSANPVWCLQSIGSEADCQEVGDRFRLDTVFGNSELVEAAREGALRRLSAALKAGCPPPTPRIETPTHVIPIAVNPHLHQCTGFVVPLLAARAEDWVVSDAFGRLGNSHPSDPLAALMDLLRNVEHEWEAKYHTVLPSRWLYPLALRLGAPVHLDLIGGKSMQFPLVVAVLRALSEAVTGGEIPFGNRPVFATGTVEESGAIGPVNSLQQKLQGFLREYGGGVALLTHEQADTLGQVAPGALAQYEVHYADSLEDLLSLEPIHNGLQALRRAYHRSLNDGVLRNVQGLIRGIEFNEVRHVSDWMRKQVSEPYYRMRFATEAAFIAFHKGRFLDAFALFRPVMAGLKEQPDLFGADDLGRLFTALVTGAIDACNPELIDDWGKQAVERLDRMSLLRRAEVAGAFCQLYRFFDQPDHPLAAVEWGRRAVQYADAGYSAGAGRTRNYLAHALIVAFRQSKDENLLPEAQELISASGRAWAPRHNAREYRAHSGFCLHLRAEIARLSGDPFALPDAPPWGGDWGQPWLFALLACARNAAIASPQRMDHAQTLEDGAKHWASRQGKDSLFELFYGLYLIYVRHLRGEDLNPAFDRTAGWLAGAAQRGAPGWGKRIEPLLMAVAQADDSATRDAMIDDLLDAVRYH